MPQDINFPGFEKVRNIYLGTPGHFRNTHLNNTVLLRGNLLIITFPKMLDFLSQPFNQHNSMNFLTDTNIRKSSISSRRILEDFYQYQIFYKYLDLSNPNTDTNTDIEIS